MLYCNGTKESTMSVENQSANFSCMTYNLRYNGDRGAFRVKNRLPRIIEKISDLSPDLLGVQEAQVMHVKALKEALSPEYDIVYCYRQRPSLAHFHPESSPILYKKEKFELLDSGHFWLSKTPDVMSRMPGAQNYRICTWVRLKEKTSWIVFYYYNLHLDFGAAQNKSLPVLLGRVQKDATVIVGGDFNLSPADENYQKIVRELSDSRLVSEKDGESATYHAYRSPSRDIKNHIDFLFYRGDIRPVSHRVVCDDETRWGKGAFASDHYPVLVNFLLTNR